MLNLFRNLFEQDLVAMVQAPSRSVWVISKILAQDIYSSNLVGGLLVVESGHVLMEAAPVVVSGTECEEC